MPSDFLTPFVELEGALCKTFLSLNVNDGRCPEDKAPPGLQRTFSACPVALAASRQGGSESLDGFLAAAVPDQSDLAWPPQCQWFREEALPRAGLPCLPFRADRSVSVIEGCPGEAKASSSRYKTELCRTFEESGRCKYGAKCQFAHGPGELRGLSRHPKYKTEPCRTFHTSGLCPYGARCHFIHNADERRPLPQKLPLLRHSLATGAYAAEALPSPTVASGLQLPEAFLPCDALSQPPTGCSLCTAGSSKALPASADPLAFSRFLLLQKSLSADSLSDQEDSGSSGGSSSSESPSLGPSGRRLPIFSQLSVSDD
uniref:mRNA decay activator protein ZFP36 n=1 Tax=Salvator merianae TaxID=96440 RepID=A0A8D0DSS8_SALMN